MASLKSVAVRARYVGSAEHKRAPSPAGQPRPRADATICADELSRNFGQITRWLRESIRRGQVGHPWEGRYPRYVWYKHGQTVYEARLVNKGSGEYKGYALERDEWPEGLR